MAEAIAVGSRYWVPDNRWDLVAGVVRPCAGSSAGRSVAIVIPYFEQPDSLRRMYAALAVAGLDGGHHEVVIVDDGSTCPPPCPPTELSLPVRLLHQEDAGHRPGAARNRGATSTTAEILVFLDADTLPAPGTIARLAAWPTVLPDALVVGRRRHADLTGWTPAGTRGWLTGDGPGPSMRPDPGWLADGYARTGDLLHADDGSYRYVISAVMACSRQLFEDIGGFDEVRAEYGGEDWELAYRAFNNGAVLVHEPTAVAWHDEPDWAERHGDLATKNGESMWLAHMIPEPTSRGAGVIHRHADTVVVLDLPPGVSAGALVTTVHALLQAMPDVSVHLPGGASAEVRSHVEGDPRVRLERPTREDLLRCRVQITLCRAVGWDDDALSQLIERLRPGGCGVIEVRDGGALIAVVRSTRAIGRVRRAVAGGLPPELAGRLTEHVVLDGTEAGLVVLPDEVDLQARFGGWRRP